ncbi:hypothetical protein BLGI_2699 [Brevibacillus laterosporus GI-9]|nr:hypothetical protein BLGI_2699 [Brevibacillus laterosporus GI-9]
MIHLSVKKNLCKKALLSKKKGFMSMYLPFFLSLRNTSAGFSTF